MPSNAKGYGSFWLCGVAGGAEAGLFFFAFRAKNGTPPQSAVSWKPAPADFCISIGIFEAESVQKQPFLNQK